MFSQSQLREKHFKTRGTSETVNTSNTQLCIFKIRASFLLTCTSFFGNDNQGSTPWFPTKQLDYQTCMVLIRYQQVLLPKSVTR